MGISEAENLARLDVETQAVRGGFERLWIYLDLTVPAATQILEIKLLRRSLLRFDNIAGTLHLYWVSLAWLDAIAIDANHSARPVARELT